MRKEEFKKRMVEAGDAVVTYRSQNSRKLKYNVCTIDFSYRILVPENVTSIVPLNRVIKND